MTINDIKNLLSQYNIDRVDIEQSNIYQEIRITVEGKHLDRTRELIYEYLPVAILYTVKAFPSKNIQKLIKKYSKGDK